MQLCTVQHHGLICPIPKEEEKHPIKCTQYVLELMKGHTVAVVKVVDQNQMEANTSSTGSIHYFKGGCMMKMTNRISLNSTGKSTEKHTKEKISNIYNHIALKSKGATSLSNLVGRGSDN